MVASGERRRERRVFDGGVVGSQLTIAGNGLLTLGNGDDVIVIAGYGNVVLAGHGDNVLTGGLGSGAYTFGDGDNTITVARYNNVVTLGAGLNVVTGGSGGGLGVQVGAAADHIVINGFDAAMGEWIHLLSPTMGYTSTDQIMSALQSDGNGGAMLARAGGGSIEISGVAPSQLGASNFRIG